MRHAEAAAGASGDQRLRVLMVSDVYLPRINGVSSSIASFRAALPAHGVTVRLVVPRYGDEADEAGIVRVAGRSVPGDPEDRLVRWRAMHAAVAREAASCDLVHTHTPFVAHYAAAAAARACRLPLVSTYHTLFEEYLQHYVPLLPAAPLRACARRISRRQCDAADAVVVPSGAMHARLAEYGVRRPLHVLPTGIDVAAFARGDGARFRAAHAIAADAAMALFVGRVAHEKNIGFLLDVAARVAPRHQGFVLVIAGEGPALAALRAKAAAQGLAEVVRFVGYLERGQALADGYAAADAFVFASRTETQGLVLLEAMAAGVPVVALAAMGTADILAPRRGALVPSDSVPDFAQALMSLLGDAALRHRLGSDARRHSTEWCDTAMAARLAQLYRTLVRRGSDVWHASAPRSSTAGGPCGMRARRR